MLKVYPGSVIEVIDTEGGALAQGLAVCGCQNGSEEKPINEIVEEITLQSQHTEHIFR